MARVVTVLILLTILLNANVYEKNCVKCHQKNGVSLKKLFYEYLLRYSSERGVKRKIYEYLKNPDANASLMPKRYISVYGTKKRSDLSDKELKKAIDIYWEKYKVFGKLK
ncbi:hypothetical protein [Nitrosophilus alvini]|uniref:hypothetical protein n=1 Tax=Nitrosophilus alvini TaxID=2714855 RepID=UPI00190AB9E6|nr:hypothetical protein [Nitrosophilus alvini]